MRFYSMALFVTLAGKWLVVAADPWGENVCDLPSFLQKLLLAVWQKIQFGDLGNTESDVG
jgi:hypothetical protein